MANNTNQHEQVTMVRGPYLDTEPHHNHLKQLKFRWNPTMKAWIGPDMNDAEVTRLSRQIASVDVEVRKIRKAFVETA